jgi:hypothetical protein
MPPTDTFRNATEERHSGATQCATSHEAAQLHTAPHNGREVLSDVAISDGEEGAKGGMKRSKQHLQAATTAVDSDCVNGRQGVAPTW